MTDIYQVQFDPNILSVKEEELGLEFADSDTALEILKRTEKTLIGELTAKYKFKQYKNITELNAYIYADDRFKEFDKQYANILKKRNRAKVRYETYKAFRNDLRTKVVNERELSKNL